MNQAPRINLNGSDKNVLLQEYKTAWTAAVQLRNMLLFTSPHGRDYQTAPTGAYEIARNQHVARLKAVDIIANELMDICEQIQNQ
jgi:hypothetical protein